jgi:glutamine synthetase
MAIGAWASVKNKDLFQKMKVFSPEETAARADVMYEAYTTTLSVEAKTLVQMVESGIIPACVKDLSTYKDQVKMAGERPELYKKIVDETEKLKKVFANVPDNLEAEAKYLCDTVKPQMTTLRALVDKAEGLMEKGLYPYPTYEKLLYPHHF